MSNGESPMGRIDRLNRRSLSAAVTCGIVAASLLGGANPAAATDPADAPPGYAGPFDSCKGTLPSLPVSDGVATIRVWQSTAGSGTYCAMVFDNRAGAHNMEVRVRREAWQTEWYDSGYYQTYAGAIYSSDRNYFCTWVSGWVEVNGTRYRSGKWLCLNEG